MTPRHARRVLVLLAIAGSMLTAASVLHGPYHLTVSPDGQNVYVGTKPKAFAPLKSKFG